MANIVKINGVKYDDKDDSYIVHSHTNPDKTYRLTPFRISKTWACECKDYVFRAHDCKHIGRLKIIDELAQKRLLTVEKVGPYDTRPPS